MLRKKEMLVRTILGLGCLGGFAYQVGNFLYSFFQYPVRNDFEVEVDPDPIVPALSVCPLFGFNMAVIRTESEKLAKRNAFFKLCMDRPIQSLDKISICFFNYAELEVLEAITYRYEDVIKSCQPENSCRYISWYLVSGYGKCHNFNSNRTITIPVQPRMDREAKEAYQLTVESIPATSDKEYHYTVEEPMTFVWIAEPEITFHLAKLTPYPPGSITFYIKKILVKLLGNPYKPDCRTYREELTKTGKGFVSALECKKYYVYKGPKLCKAARGNGDKHNLDTAKRRCMNVNYENMTEERQKTEVELKRRNKLAAELCPEDCQRILYDYDEKQEFSKKSNATAFDYIFRFTTFEYTISALKPLYKNIEVFGYVGGYLGVWLGFSLLDLIHVFTLSLNFCASHQRTERAKMNPRRWKRRAIKIGWQNTTQ